MANEIKINVTTRVQNAGFKDTFQPGQILVDQASNLFVGGIVEVSNALTELSFGDVAEPGYCVINNLDTLVSCDYGLEDGTDLAPFGRVKPGEVALFRVHPDSTSLFVQGSDGSNNCTLEYRLYSD